DFDGDRAGVGKEHAVQVVRHKRSKAPCKPKRLFVREATEHDMRHGSQLGLDRPPDVRMVVTVTRGPPAGDAVDQLTPIRQHDAGSLGTGHRQGWHGRFHLGVRKPDILKARVIPTRHDAVFAGPARHLTFLRSVRAKHLAYQHARLSWTRSSPSPKTSSTNSNAGICTGR